MDIKHTNSHRRLDRRVWVAQIFLRDGWFKLQNWDSTLHTLGVPIGVAAIAAEIILPILLILGLGGRIMILLFLIFNIITMYSYNFVWTPEGSTNLNQQIAWAMLLMLLMLHGPGKFSVDYWLHRRHGHHLKLKK